MESCPSLHLGVVAIEKGTFGSLLTTVASFTYICLVQLGFYGISTFVGYLMPNPLYKYILNIYHLVWLGLWHFNLCRLFNAKSSL